MNISATFSNLKKNFNQAPLELRLFAIFSTIVTVLSIIMLYAAKEQEWYRNTIPFTGWSPASTYMFGLVLAVILIFQGNKGNFLGLRYSIPVILVVGIFYGIQRQFDYELMKDNSNPYLRISQYQYIWTVLIPTFWALLILFSPKINKLSANVDKKFS